MRMTHLLRVACAFLFTALWFVCIAMAQTETATVSGFITDETGAVVPGVEVNLQSVERGTFATATTNDAGIYVFASVHPGQYQVTVHKPGFKQVDLLGMIVNVQDHIEQNFRLQLGSVAESVTVNANDLHINTQDATVSTVVDRTQVENMPLNGRSFQALIALTPGVVMTPAGLASGNLGQFSVNGQRADANYFTVDGVSANFGTTGSTVLGQTIGGAIPGLSAQGGTNSLVSVDALQEYRIQTSSFAPEFGRTPGGQVSIITRSGTNQFHGTFFDYFRNDALDANDWFANRSGLPKAKERQNDFGGVFGGPLVKNRTFFFFSYEGLRLRQPLTVQIVVPSVASRQAAPVQIQPFLNAYPVPNGSDLGNGFAQLNASFSNPSSLDAYSIRIDHAITSKTILFGRYNYSPSEVVSRTGGLSVIGNFLVKLHALTVGVTQSLTKNATNELRANYSTQRAQNRFLTDSFGGAVPLTEAQLGFPSGFSSRNSEFLFLLIGSGNLAEGTTARNQQRQVNVLDNFSLTSGTHQFKFGVDYRWLSPVSGPLAYFLEPVFSGINGPRGTTSGIARNVIVQASHSAVLVSHNLSFYGQDTWKMSPRVTLVYGLRWDINPALRGKNSDSDLFTVQGLDNPSTMTLAPPGTSMYRTTYGNVAPRVGLVYQLRQQVGWETVLRGGFGTFYDLGTGFLGAALTGFPFSVSKALAGVPFPLTTQQAAPPPFSQSPPVSQIFVTDPNLKLPRTYQWNAALEQSLGANQTLSLTYVGATGRNLLRTDTLISPNASFANVFVIRNTATSDYHAFQVKLQRRLSRGLQVLAGYTWSHSIDIASSDSSVLNAGAAIGVLRDRGDSDFDVRHSLTGSVIYNLPSGRLTGMPRAVFRGWSLDNYITTRSALPATVVGPTFIVGSTAFQARPNVVPGVSLYLFGPQFPGHKAFNSAAFVNPPSGQQGNLGRNVLRGFGAWQDDFALYRQFHLTERLGLQFRSEFFNIFNHPGFGAPVSSLASPLFGKSTQTLASSFGSGGLAAGFNPLYQIGGPRSIQFALKLAF